MFKLNSTLKNSLKVGLLCGCCGILLDGGQITWKLIPITLFGLLLGAYADR